MSRITSDTGPWALVPEWVLEAPVSDRAIRLYGVLSRHADDHGRNATPGRRKLSDKLHCSMRSVDRAIDELVRVKSLVVKHRRDEAGDWTSNEYHVLRARPESAPGSDTGDATGSDTSGETGSDTSGDQPKAPLNESPLNEKKSSQEPKTKRAEDPIWEAVLQACRIDAPSLTKSERSNLGKTVQELKGVGAQPEQIRGRAGEWRKRYPQAALTHNALRNHWAELGGRPKTTARPVEPEVDEQGQERLHDIAERLAQGMSA